MYNPRENLMYQSTHYDIDEQTLFITFNTDHHYYQLEREVFASDGIDIDAVKTIDTYYGYIKTFHYEIRAVFHQHLKNKEPKTLGNKFTRSLILGDENDVNRLEGLANKMKRAKMSFTK